jgi:glycosyltransferase involved in cell wall biosynthesis
MAESMATGTPVIGIDLGSVREVVEDGVTGFVVPDLECAITACSHIYSIDRAACRERVERLFSVDAMTDGYLNVYRTILGAM